MHQETLLRYVPRPVGILVPRQGGHLSKERVDAYRLGYDGHWVYYRVSPEEGLCHRFARDNGAPRRDLKRVEWVVFQDLPIEAQQEARRLAAWFRTAS